MIRAGRWSPQNWVGARQRARNPPPLWLQHPEKPYWHAFLDGGSTLYVQYNQVQDEPGGAPISAYFPRLFAAADRRRVERVIIDVRLNGGGNNELNRPIWQALLRSDRLNQKGRLWVVIGPKTFSAAMNFVDDMELNTHATFVGEPTGETPEHVGRPGQPDAAQQRYRRPDLHPVVAAGGSARPSTVSRARHPGAN